MLAQASRPSSSRRQNVVRSGAVKVALRTVEVFLMDSVRNFHPGGLDLYLTSDTPSAAARAIHTLDCEEP